ncbi:MAG: ATP-dependent helicase [Elusimicrobiales bacterium]|nr:ATP-dependent helicase [Elusimicrobiales bacterium]
MSTEKFKAAWAGLNPIQREASQWNEGSLLVLAGPGSGKTRVLTCRIARILDESVDKNFRILGLTFTTKAADEMRTRVTDLVPGQETRLFLGTFHSFCADVLRQHGVHVGINPNFQIYSQYPDLKAVLSEAVESAKKENPIVSDADKETLSIIERMKSMLILPEQAQGVFQDPDFGKRMGVIYSSYEIELAKRNALDFNSLILKTYQLFNNFPAIAKRYRIVYPYICVDEFQDTNHAQYSLLRALTGDQHKNLFIVADDDQIIYQWNGASHKRLEEFATNYSPQVLQLPMNYRCPPEVVDLANNLIKHNFLRTPDKKPLEAYRPPQGDGVVRVLDGFGKFEDEALGIAKDIQTHHLKTLGSVAVLGRSRKLLDGVQNALNSLQLPSAIMQRKDEFESTPFIWLHSILKLANDRQNQGYLEAVCGSFAQLTGLEVDPAEVVMQARAANRDLLQHWLKLVKRLETNDVIKKVLDQTGRSLGEGRDFRQFSRDVMSWFNQLVSEDLTPGEEVYARYTEERTVWENLVREITASLGEDTTLEAFLQELQMHSKEAAPHSNTILLMTIHGAKGKEFSDVYLVGLVEDELPSFQSKKKGPDSPEMEEERRNCFVAITRTINTLTLSYAGNYSGWPKKPSRFLYEMGLLSS